ncbi:hypothetical protein C8F04DRAFT_1079894 [Mycena alexandri]|uniref:Uncharacterized protein n=1 Tax=Mycena alexandri TaxID=1745969 RepID=A0AAD6XAY8_9AGAR|nr:hypothetical protein C8F04DRAFT_1079894 [Mycena alexandri]
MSRSHLPFPYFCHLHFLFPPSTCVNTVNETYHATRTLWFPLIRAVNGPITRWRLCRQMTLSKVNIIHWQAMHHDNVPPRR